MAPSGFQSVYRIERNQDAVAKAADKLARLMGSVESVQQCGVIDEEKQFQRTTLARQLSLDPFVNIDLGSRRNFDCDDSRIGRIAK
jgi:hypothetical protein